MNKYKGDIRKLVGYIRKQKEVIDNQHVRLKRYKEKVEKHKIEKVISEKVIKQHIHETRKVWQR